MRASDGLGRVYEVRAMADVFPHVRADLLRCGFDGRCYLGVSLPTGHQRKTYHGLFCRRSTGEFVFSMRIADKGGM